MGEESYYNDGPVIFCTENGRTYELNLQPALPEVQFDAENDLGKTFVQHFDLAKEMSFTVSLSKKQYFAFMLGGNKRKIRRAFRWYEKYRRKGYSREDLVPFACFAVLAESNNKKRRKEEE